MDIKRLNSFVTVAEQGTVSKAANLLRITQPALSRQISGLEQEIGFELFAREGRRLTLTARGEQLLGDCRSLLSHAATVSERAQSLRRGDIRVLKVAASAITIEGTFPTFLRRFASAHPDVRLSLIEADASDHLSMLERGEAHLAVNVINVVPVDEHRFGSFLLPPFHILAACAPSAAVGDANTIDIRRLAEQPLLLPHASYATRILFDAACRLAGVRPHIFIESGAAHALLALAETGHGVAIIPSILRPSHSPLHIMRVTHRGEPIQIALAVLWDKQRTLPRHAETFSGLLAQHIREQFPQASPRRTSAKLRALTTNNIALLGRQPAGRKARAP